MALTLTLAPTILLITWSMFATSENSVISLVCLLAMSLILPVIYMDKMKLFWPCGLLMILMSTGLIVIFAYIASLHSKEQKPWNTRILTLCFCSILGSLLYAWAPTFKMVRHVGWSPDVAPELSLLLITLLLYLVVSFIRIVYSKGGGFRKKF